MQELITRYVNEHPEQMMALRERRLVLMATEGDEMSILCRIVEAEATDCTKEQKMNVASVVLNRLHTGDWGHTIEDVVFSPMQFQPTRDGRYYKVTVTEETRRAVYEVWHFGITTTALYFHSYTATNTKYFKNNHTEVMRDGAHIFYE